MVDYSDQAINNQICLFEDEEYHERKEVFLKILKAFEEEGDINWAVGCSLDLFLRGVVDEFHDFDLIVDSKNVNAVKEIMEEKLRGELKATGGNGFCESDMYMHYQIGRVDVDVIAGFRVLTFGTSYYYKFDSREIDFLQIPYEGIKVPLISLEAMYILYFMMEGWQPKRKFKRLLIEEYFKQNPLQHKNVFKKALAENNLPGRIRWGIREISEE